MRLLASCMLLIVTGLTLGGCQREAEELRLQRELRAKGLEVSDVIGKVSSPFFSPIGHEMRVKKTELVAVYQYANSSSLRSELQNFGKDGTPAYPADWEWTGPPHLYRASTAVILYVGKDEDVLRALRELYGEQIAGQ